MKQSTLPVSNPPLLRGGDSSIGGLLLQSGKITPENAEQYYYPDSPF